MFCNCCTEDEISHQRTFRTRVECLFTRFVLHTVYSCYTNVYNWRNFVNPAYVESAAVSLPIKGVYPSIGCIALKSTFKLFGSAKHFDLDGWRKALAIGSSNSFRSGPERTISESINGVPVHWIHWPGVGDSTDTSTIVYLHGGGYCAGSGVDYRHFLGQLARVTKSRIIAIDYRLCPEYSVQDSVADVVSVYSWMLNDQQMKSSRISFAGDSAGAGLVVLAMQNIRDKTSLELPCCSILFSPWVDLTVSSSSYETNEKSDVLFSGKLYFQGMAKCVLRGEDPVNSQFSALHGDMQGLPPTFISVAADEMLLDDSIKLSEKLQDAGVKCLLETTPNMFHIFPVYVNFLPEAHALLQIAANFLFTCNDNGYAKL